MASGFVWLVWAAMASIALAAVYLYATRIPYLDEWNAIVPSLTGQRSTTLAWLWSPHNEHRLFLPRLLDLGLLALSGGDFRIGAYCNVALLAVMSAGCLRAAALVRGTASFTDAIFPILLMHLRHFENIFMMFQNQVIIPVGCALVALFVAAGYGAEMESKWLVVCGAALLLMPLCGAYGLPIAFPSAFWLACVAGFRCRRREPADRRDFTALLLAAAALTVCIAYLVGLKRSEPVASDAAAKFAFVVNLLRFSMGISEAPWLSVVQRSVLFFVPLAIGLLVWRWFRVPAARACTVGVSAFLVGALTIPVAIASGRDPHLFPSRYFLHSALIPVAIYVVFLLIEKDAGLFPGRPILTTLLFAAVFLLAVTSIVPLWKVSAGEMEKRLQFEDGMANQVPLPKLLAACGDKEFLSREYLYGKVLDLCRARSGAFRDYHPDADFTTVPLPFGPATLHANTWDATGKPQECPIAWQNGSATISQIPGQIIQLVAPMGNPGPRTVRGIRLHYTMDADEISRARTGFTLQWARPSDNNAASETEFLDSVWHPAGKPVTLYIDDKIDAVSLFPRGPFRSVTISGIDLCLPVGESR